MRKIETIVVDYAGTLSNGRYFHCAPAECPDLGRVASEVLFAPDSALFDPWMEDRLCARDIATAIAPLVHRSAAIVERCMRERCRGLPLNAGVVEFVQTQRRLGRRAALVTVNVDLFTEIVVPDQHLDLLFDVIVNSADYGTLDKRNLWPIAFEELGGGYATAFAIDDSLRNVRWFTELGGFAYCYTGDDALRSWLDHCAEWAG
jgi:phosphoserine phosphatase